jgi:GNAT superfamily N-acetyltransferase
MPHLKLKLTRAEFRQLPRNAAYRYSYYKGAVWLSPRPRYYHACLDLRSGSRDSPADVLIRPIQTTDWDALVAVFADAFVHQQPFSSLGPKRRQHAARAALEQTRSGGDGPWIERASSVATLNSGEIVGAALITLVPLSDPTEWGAYIWLNPPPPGSIELRLGRPHLTWIFVSPTSAGRGIGTALLQRVTVTLRDMGFDELHTTFMAGNDSSMLWHWRNGFSLIRHPSSRWKEE